MTEQEMIRHLHSAIEHAAPDAVGDVLSRCGAQKGTEDMTQQERPVKNRRTRRMAPWLAAACLALIIAGGGMQYTQSHLVRSIISVDVNPSVELKLNAKSHVISAVALNRDGEEILEGLKLEGADANVAVNALIGSLLQHGYVDELANSILISVEDGDSVRGAALQQELTTEVEAILDAASLNAAILTQSVEENEALRQQADEYGISLGKAQLIETLVQSSDHLTFAALAGLSVNELNLLASNTSMVLPETVQTSGKASDSAYIGAEAAKTAAFRHAGVSENQVSALEVDFDYEDGVMVYEVEFAVQGVEHDCDVDASTGAIVKYKTEGMQQTTGNDGTSAGGTATQGKDIGSAAAKEAALKHAGVSESQVSGLRVETDWDDGVLEYKVEFFCNRTEYEYEINGATGAILSVEQDQEDTASSGDAGAAANHIGIEAAKTAALQHAGISAKDVYDLSVESELDDRIPHYEVEFKSGGIEYGYEIDASTGAVLQYEREQDD